jgi:transcriptional regulator with XRE-family HTH domain
VAAPSTALSPSSAETVDCPTPINFANLTWLRGGTWRLRHSRTLLPIVIGLGIDYSIAPRKGKPTADYQVFDMPPCKIVTMRRAPLRSTPTNEEKRNVSEFFSCAVAHWGSQLKLAKATGLRQPTINGIINGTANAGSRSLLALADICGITIEDILSGAGAMKLRSRRGDAAHEASMISRHRAAKALSELFEMSLPEALSIFDELGTFLPVEVPATVWFDVGRSAIERKRAGLEVSRRAKDSDFR